MDKDININLEDDENGIDFSKEVTMGDYVYHHRRAFRDGIADGLLRGRYNQETHDKYENEEHPRGKDYKEGYDYGLVLYEEQNEMREWLEYREGSEPKVPQPSNPTGMKIVQKAKHLIHGKGKDEWYD